jgi:Ca-activated chloride channel family protein
MTYKYLTLSLSNFKLALRSFTIIALFLLSAAVSSVVQANADYSDPGSGVLVLNHDGGLVLPAMQLDTDIVIRASGLLADVTVTQTFRNERPEWAEGKYLFPLPTGASIRGLTVTVGDRTIKGEIQKRETAKHTYEKAKNAGQVASLIEQQRPNLFTANVASIAPQDEISVTIDILLPIKVVDGELNLTFPTTMTPRYTNINTGDAAAITGPFTQTTQQRGPRFNLSAQVQPITDHTLIKSSSHILQIELHEVTLRDIPMDRDLVITWPFTLADSEETYTFTSQHNGQRYAQLLLTPPASVNEATIPARELILIVDKSGSMGGVSIRAAREALHFALDNLSNRDTFNIIAFDNDTYPFSSVSVPVNDKNITKARRFINRLDAAGGTEMQGALRHALTTKKAHVSDDYPESNRFRQIVFVTDGSVGNEDLLLNYIKQHLGSSRLFTVGIGSAPNSWFIEQAAEAGRGVALNIRDEQSVAAPLTQLLQDMMQPVLTDINIQASKGQFELYPKPIPDLYSSSPLMLVAKISDDLDTFIVTSQHNNKRWKKTVKLNEDTANPAPATDTAPSLAMQWTRSKVNSLLTEQRYAADSNMHADVITQLALDVGLQTKYTSFVAVEDVPVKPSTEQMPLQKVANLIPAGNNMLAISMPQGASGTDTLLWLSALFAVFGFGTLAMARRYQ